jgi:hypothetical protein
MDFNEKTTNTANWSDDELQKIYTQVLEMIDTGRSNVALDRLDLITQDEDEASLFKGLQGIGDIPEDFLLRLAVRLGLEYTPDEAHLETEPAPTL